MQRNEHKCYSDLGLSLEFEIAGGLGVLRLEPLDGSLEALERICELESEVMKDLTEDYQDLTQIGKVEAD